MQEKITAIVIITCLFSNYDVDMITTPPSIDSDSVCLTEIQINYGQDVTFIQSSMIMFSLMFNSN